MVVAASKLSIPRTRRPLVPRPDLFERLDGDYRVALLSAPAGYGKTATLASWAAGQGAPTAWLSCDSFDAEPMRFISGLLCAISARWPGTADDAIEMLDRDADPYDAAMSAVNRLGSIGGEGVVVIDDLHYASQSSRNLLNALVDSFPAGFKFAVGTRSDPPLSLARLRVRGELLELRSEQLRFAPTQLAEFFAVNDLHLGPDDLGRLHGLTEGWPGGAQLAAIAMLQAAGRVDFIDAFESTDRSASDFLLSEVLDGLPTELIDFLIETSVLERFDADLCATVTGDQHAGATLEHLLSTNLFLVALDDCAEWFRYHHLFASFLRARLASFGRARVLAAHGRASHALEERGFFEAALQQAMTVRDVDRVGTILRSTIARSMHLGSSADDLVRAIRLWLQERGPAAVESAPAWTLELLIGLMEISGPEDAAAWIGRVGEAHPSTDGALLALIEDAWNEHHQNSGQPLQALRHLELACAAVEDVSAPAGPLGLLAVTIARAHIQAGQLDRAATVIEDARARAIASPTVDRVRIEGVAAYTAACNGDLRSATTLVHRCHELADELRLDRTDPRRLDAALALAAVHLEHNELEAALEAVAVAQAAATGHRVPLRTLATMHEARIMRALGDEQAATALLARVTTAYDEPDRAVRHLLAEEAIVHALRFDPASASELLPQLDPDRQATQVLRARCALASGDGPAAAIVLATLNPPSTRLAHVEWKVLTALSVLRADVDSANRHLREAIVLAQPDHLIRTIVDAGPDVHRLLASFPATADEQPYVDALLNAAAGATSPIRVTARQPLIDPLSAREVTVLRYLCSRLTYLEIARALFVSLNTLKSHVRTIYRKLDVATRRDAVDAGRRVGLI